MKLKSLLIILLFNLLIYPQSLWEISNPDETFRGFKDSSVTALKGFILDKQSMPLEYAAAANIIAYFHKDSLKEFLLENLNTNLDIGSDGFENYSNIEKYYTDQVIKGYLGNQSAIAGLDTFINKVPSIFTSRKLDAIYNLATANVLRPEYFQILKDEFSLNGTWKQKAQYSLKYYGMNAQYKQEVEDLFLSAITASDDPVEINSLCLSLSQVDSSATVSILNQLFESHTGEKRLNFFDDLNYFDPKGQPERSMWAIPREQDESIRSEYFPLYDSIEDGILPKSYLTPEWINFIINWKQQEESDLITVPLTWFLYDFKPLPSYNLKTVSDLIDNLVFLTDTVYSYNWLSNVSFKDDLKAELQSAKTNLQNSDSIACAINIKSFQDSVDAVYKDSLNSEPRFVTLEGWKFLYWNAQYILDRLPEIPYSLFATHSMWLKENSIVLSGDVGVNEAGLTPFLDSEVELSVGIGVTTPAGYSIKANRIKVKQSATINGDVYYNELDNNGTIAGSQNTPLELPLVNALPVFKSSTPGTNDIVIPINGAQTLQPGSYGTIQVKKNGKLILTGGVYNINLFNGGIDNQIVFQSPSEVRIADKFDSGQGSYIGPEDTTTVSAKDIIFYVGGINGSNGNLGATPKAAKIGISNSVRANFYVPNGTLWIKEHSVMEGRFIAKDIEVGIGVKVKLNSAF